ncbi:MAG: outer membrane beta-barrel protein [Sphingobacteriales bacterium]|nr:outer membrane beta-barrel protein [Sphingobacteriales bacterium]
MAHGTNGIISTQKVLKGAGTLTLNVADIFDTMRFKVTAEDDSLVQEVVRKRQSRFANLSFTYRFGKTDKKKRSERPEMPRNDMPDMGF